MERRYFELRAESDGRSLSGYAAKYNKRSKKLATARGNGFIEQLRAGCFDKALRKSDTVLLVEHDTNRPLARKSAGTLSLTSDSVGLRVNASLDMGVSYARDCYQNIKNGNIRGMSFGFTCDEGDEWDETTDDEGERCALRTINEVDELFDVSAVLVPAYSDSECSVRSLFPTGVPVGVEVRSAWGMSGVLKANKFRKLTTEETDQEMLFLRRMALKQF
jgi:HK97 family phage prohead protease